MSGAYIQELRYFSLIDQHCFAWLKIRVCSSLNLLYTFVPFPSTGARGRIGVSGPRRPSVLPLTLTAVWRLSLTRTALLYQHTASPWVCLSFHQSPLCHSARNVSVYEQSLRVALYSYSHVHGKWQPGRGGRGERERERERERHGWFSQSMCNLGLGDRCGKKKGWELFLWRWASLSASLMHLPRGWLHFLKAPFNCFCAVAKNSGEWSTAGDEDHFKAIVWHIGKYTYLLP